MTADRIKEIQQETAFPDSVSVCQALFQVWNECQQENYHKKYTEEDIVKALFKGFDYCLDNMTEDSSEITQENVQDFINSLNKQE